MSKRKKDQNKRSALFLLFGGGLSLIAVGILLYSQNRAPAPAQPAAPIAEEIPYPEIARASLTDAKAALEAGAAILVDVRSADAYAGQHIDGAISIPTAEIETRLTELDPNAWIIPYCT